MSESCKPSADDPGSSGPIRLARILDLPELRSVRRVPTRPDLIALVEFCEARLAQVGRRPDTEEARLAGENRTRFTL